MEKEDVIEVAVKKEEIAFEGDVVNKIIEKKPRSAKQLEAQKASSERLAKIHAMKREERERQAREEKEKMVADLKEKWLKEYQEELDSNKKTVIVKAKGKPRGISAVPRKPLTEEQKKKLREKPLKEEDKKPLKEEAKPVEEKHVKYLDEDEYSEDSESDSEDDHVPKPKKGKKKYQAEESTDAETTDTRTIKKKLDKVKQIEQVVNKQGTNPYLSLIEKYWKK